LVNYKNYTEMAVRSTGHKIVFFYIQGKSVFSYVQFTVPVLSVYSLHGTFEPSNTKNGGVAMAGQTHGSMNGPVGHSWSRVFCYKLPVLYSTKFSIRYLNANVFPPVFRPSPIITCNQHRVSSEYLVMQTH
jgi:hypothetical protein